MKKATVILRELVFWAVILSILAACTAFALNTDPEKSIFGYRVYNVLSGSMTPTLGVGDMVVVKVTPAEQVQTGDIITYYPTDNSGVTVTHRVKNTMMKDGAVVLETQGDAVDQPDALFYGDAVIGVVVFHVPLLGGILTWAQKSPVLALGIAALAIAFICLLGMLLKKEPSAKIETRRENKSLKEYVR